MSLQNLSNILSMLGRVLEDDQNVIQINYDKVVLEILEEVHQTLENGRGIGQAKWPDKVFILAIMSVEGHFHLSLALMHTRLYTPCKSSFVYIRGGRETQGSGAKYSSLTW